MMFRTATLAETDTLLSLWRAAYAMPTTTDDEHGIKTLLQHDPEALIVAEAGGNIVGSVIAAWDGWRGTIYRLVVAEDHRRTGLAGQLLHRAEQRLTQLGARRLQAIAVATSAHAIGFWRASGWEEQTERLRFVR